MRNFYFLFFLSILFFYSGQVFSQSCVPTGLNGTTINLPCGVTCGPLKVQVPHLKSTEDYVVTSIPYTPFPYITGAPALVLPCANQDDKFFDTTFLPFQFCFYSANYTKLVVGTNGLITFDSTNAQKGNNYTLSAATQIPYAGTGSQGTAASCPTPSGSLFPRASIMGVYCDLYPQTSDRQYKIEARIEGNAPCRKYIVSFYNVALYGCPSSRATTEIVLYESTGLVEVFIESKPACASNGGLAVLGIQNWQRNKGVAAPGKNSTQWSETNTAYRFTPSGPVSRFIKSELYDLTGNIVQTTTPADTATTASGLLDVNFTNVCITGRSKQFVVKTYFSACPSGDQLISTDTITVNKGTLGVTTSSSASSCGPNGTATITVPSGSGPYTYTLDGNPSISSANATYTFNGLSSGTYTLTASNATGCTATASVTVASNGGLSIQAIPMATSCAGAANGKITVKPQNGTAPFQYNLNNGAYQTADTFNGLAAGSYIVGIKDASGCQLTNYPVTIAAGPGVTASAMMVNVSCNGGNNGSLSLNLSANATAPYLYSLDGINYQGSNVFANLAAATYTVSFKEANGCAGTLPVIISQPSAITQIITKQDARCNGQSNGQLTIVAGGGTPAYQYSINGSSYQSSNTFTVAAGNYTTYVRDAAGCVSTSTGIVSQPGLLNTTVQTGNATCNGGADGTIAATTAGGTSPYQYAIDGTNFQAAPLFNVASNAYTLTSKDANGCTATTSARVGLTNNLTLSTSADTVICQGSSATLSAISNATQLLWSPANTLSNALMAAPIASPTDTTTYIVMATLGVCTVKDSVTVNVNKAPVSDAGANHEICFGQRYVLQAGGGSTYNWSPATYFDNGSTTSTQNPSITPSQTITYILNTTDSLGCASLQSASVTITVTPPIMVKASPRDTVVAKGDVFILSATSPVVDYIWSPGFGLDNPAKQTPTVTVDNDITYTVTAYTAAGCKGSDTVRIKVYNGPELYVPTGFTPNGDGKNDLLLPFPVGIKQLNFFRVYNRWGQLIFQTNTLNKGWDGKLNGVLQPVATYVWMAEAVTKENIIIRKRGTATLVR